MTLKSPIALWRLVPVAALAAVLVLVAGGVYAAIYSEQLYKSQTLDGVNVQSQLLADSVSAALAFDDPATVDRYVQALRVNPDIEAVGVYDASGVFVAGYAVQDADAPPRAVQAAAPALVDNRVVTVTPVTEGGAELGMVYLRAVAVPLASRLVRYGVIALFTFMALLVAIVLGLAHAALKSAVAELEAREAALAASKEEILVQIRERNLAEEALRQSQKMEAIGQLTGGIAHDFNNLLAAVTSGLRLLDHFDDKDRRAEVMKAMQQAVERGAQLTQQLLSFSRRKALNPEVIAPQDRLQAMRPLLQRTLREDILVVIEAGPDLWRIEADPSQLELAIINLAVNARDAMPSGGTITIRAENLPGDSDEADRVRFSVIDTGSGMSPETARRAFEPFFTTKDMGKGTGLGLSQVYGFATQSGGSAEIESVLGKGSTVHLTLPRSRREVAAPTAEALLKRAEARKALRQQNRRLLMVEDDDAVAALVQPLLEQLGYRALRVASAQEALDTLASGERFDLIFSDIMMAGDLNGLQLARLLRERDPALPIVLTTGYSPAVDTAAAEFPLLKKPYQPDELARILEDNLQA